MTGIRGAITATENTRAAILEASDTLLRTMLAANGLAIAQIIDILFTATPDLTAAYPAAAARALGITEAGLMCMQEMAVDNSLCRCIRVLMHVNPDPAVSQRDMRHVYLREAAALRPDLAFDKNKPFAVAIDGPSGAGKSTVAKAVAKTLHMLYVDTGAMYRAVAFYGLRQGVPPSDAKAVENLLTTMDMRWLHTEAGQRLLLNGEDVTDALRTQAVAEAASVLSVYPAVRTKLLVCQQALARESQVVMDGRDIGTVVLPWAQVKIYMDASPETRINRRLAELRQKGIQPDPATVRQEVMNRDARDRNRAAAPLVCAADAVYVDTSDMDADAAVAFVLSIVRERMR